MCSREPLREVVVEGALVLNVGPGVELGRAQCTVVSSAGCLCSPQLHHTQPRNAKYSVSSPLSWSFS